MLAAAFVAIGVGGFNYLVDPWGLNYQVQYEGFNRGKPEPARYARLAKAYSVMRMKPTAAVFGTSTAEQGISMTHPSWREFPRALNLAFAGATAEEILFFVQATNAESKLRRIAVALDFFSFNGHLRVSPQLDQALEAMRNPLVAWQPYFSWKMFAGSLYTWLQQPSLSSYYLATGQSDPAYFQSWLTGSGGHRRVFLFSERGLINGVMPPPAFRFELRNGGGPSSIDHLRKLAEFAQREGIELRMFFSPVHARLLDTIRTAQLWPAFEGWKRQVVVAVDPIAQRAHGTISIWDFADYSAITSEPVPAAHDAVTRMRWFWDAQHYKPELGNLVLERLFGAGNPDALGPQDYGVQVSAANIDMHLLAIRGRQHTYEVSHPDEVAEVHANIEKALQTRIPRH